MNKRLFATVLAATLICGPALAQGSAGQFECQMSYTELNSSGNRTSGFVRHYMIALYNNGMFEAGGTFAGAAGEYRFQSQGRWQQQSNGYILAQGPEQQDFVYAQPGTFVFEGVPQPDGTLSYTYEMPDPSQSYVMNRTHYYCERRG